MPSTAYRTALAAGVALFIALPASAVSFDVTNLVTDDQTANPAQITDAGLTNAWGLAYSPTGPFWISSNGQGTSPIYKVVPSTQATTKQGLVVSIPGAGNVTGQVFNAANGSGAFNANLFLFVSEDGTVSGWRGALGTTAQTLVSGSADNVYKGAAFGVVTGNAYLYAANFHSGAIDVVKGIGAAPDLGGNFTDPNLPSGFAPFNIQNLGGSLYVAYAKQDASGHDEVAGAGLGYVDRFDLNGNFVDRIAGGGALNAPWGLALAPASFGALAGALLVGNFGDGHISAYDSATHAFLGQLSGAGNQPISIDGLWALSVGNDGNAGSSQALYFTAGPGGETHGLFGVLTAVPEPSTPALLLAGVGMLALLLRRRALTCTGSRSTSRLE